MAVVKTNLARKLSFGVVEKPVEASMKDIS
jgi:hypothetical protein